MDTTHIRLRTDLDPEEAKRLATQWQEHRDALASAAFECATDQEAEPIAVTVFQDADDYNTIAPRDVDAVIEASKSSLAEIPREIVMRMRQDTTVLRQELLHRATHDLSAQCYPQLPPWLNEGLALFYETIELEGRDVIAGGQKYTFVPENELPNERSRRPKAITVVPESAVPALPVLLAYDFEEFYQYTGLLDALREREQVLLMGRYGGAWALTHALQTADISTYARLQQFMVEVRFGERTMTGAWERTMQGVNLRSLYEDWTAIQIRYPTIALAAKRTERPAPASRVMTQAEVARHLASRFDWSTKEGRERALVKVDDALAIDPEDAAAHLLRAAIAQAGGDVAQTAAALSYAIGLEPDNPTILRAQLVFLLDDPGSRLSDPRTPDELAKALERTGSTALELDAIARYYLSEGDRVMDARYWAARALRRDPTCAPCRVTAGDILEAAGQPNLAVSMYRRALNLAAHDAGFDREAVLQAIARTDTPKR